MVVIRKHILWTSVKDNLSVEFSAKIAHRVSGNLEDGLGQPLLLDANERQDEDVEDNDDNEEDPEESHKPATSLAAAYRLLTPSVKVSIIYLLQTLHLYCPYNHGGTTPPCWLDYQLPCVSSVLTYTRCLQLIRFSYWSTSCSSLPWKFYSRSQVLSPHSTSTGQLVPWQSF